MSEERPTRFNNQRLLWIIALTSLGFNVLVIVVVLVVRSLVGDFLSQTNQYLYQSLQRLENYAGYDMPVHLNQTVVLESADEVLFEDVLEVPISLTVPISQNIPFKDNIVVPIRESIQVNDTVRAPLQINGTTIYIDVPVQLKVPVNLDVIAPVDTQVPVRLNVPLNTTLQVPVRELIPLRNGEGLPLTIGLDLQTKIPVPMDALLQDVYMLPMLQEMHKALNVLEALFLLPLPAPQP